MIKSGKIKIYLKTGVKLELFEGKLDFENWNLKIKFKIWNFEKLFEYGSF